MFRSVRLCCSTGNFELEMLASYSVNYYSLPAAFSGLPAFLIQSGGVNSGQLVAGSVYCGWLLGCMQGVGWGGVGGAGIEACCYVTSPPLLMSLAGLMIAHYTAAALGEFLC